MTREDIRREEDAFDAAAEALEDELYELFCEDGEKADGEFPSFEEWKRARLERAKTIPAPKGSLEGADSEVPF